MKCRQATRLISDAQERQLMIKEKIEKIKEWGWLKNE